MASDKIICSKLEWAYNLKKNMIHNVSQCYSLWPKWVAELTGQKCNKLQSCLIISSLQNFPAKEQITKSGK